MTSVLMTSVLTSKARIEQVGARLWATIDNQLVKLADGRILIAPRFLLTDNNSNPFGDNDLSDVRASHFHDIGCKFHQLIFVKLSHDDLIGMGYLKPHFSYTSGAVMVCEDIPIKHLDIKKVGFDECNDVFKEILLACKTPAWKAALMRFAVGCNLGWFFGEVLKLDPKKLYKETY